MAMTYEQLLATLNAHTMGDWASVLRDQLKYYFDNINHGNYPTWQQAIAELPNITPSVTTLQSDTIIIGDKADCTTKQYQCIKQQLKTLRPWRKGPFNLFGIPLEAEWQSHLKWDRLCQQIKPLTDKIILDVGCGNGYYGWRMLGQGANYVVGLEPMLLFLMQFFVFKQYLPKSNIDLIPFGIEALPERALQFDTVFSMGVLYHRRDPIAHLRQLHRCLRQGGELVLESLIVTVDGLDLLKPTTTYAKMNNVRAIPSPAKLMQWVEIAGFKNARIIDITQTTCFEQRQTDWMQFESLADFQDKEDENKTIEGYPAPTRAILLAEK